MRFRAAAASLRVVADSLEQHRPIAIEALPIVAIAMAAIGDTRVALRLLADDLEALVRIEDLRAAPLPSSPPRGVPKIED